MASAGGSIGLLSGGVLTDLISWHWIFFINLPIGVVTGLLALRLIEPRPGIGLAAGADLRGAVLLTAGLMLGVYTILGITEHGWTSNRTLGLGAIAAVLLTAFVVRQARIANPLMPLRLFRSRNVTGSNLVMAMLVVGMFGLFFLGALYLQQILGYTPLAGRARVPALDARDGRRLAAPLAAADHALRAAGDADPEPVRDHRRAAAVRPHAGRRELRRRHPAGHAADRPRRRPLDARADDAGDVGRDARRTAGSPPGLVNTTVQVGGAIGLAVLATLASQRTGDATGAAALNSGYHLAYLIGAAGARPSPC